MRTLALLLISLAAAVAAPFAHAELSAFGFTLGKTTYAEVQSRGQAAGTNRYSGGPMLTLSPGEVTLEGLQSFLLIFDPEQRLAAMVLTIGKHRFDSVHELLRGRYAVREARVPFVGNRYVRYGATGSTIELDAPHLSFEMTLLYQRDDFVKAFRAEQQRERDDKQRREANQF